MRVLVFSHGHPTFSKGGGEFAAYYLYKGIDETPGHEAWFAARGEEKLLHLGTPIASLNKKEYLISGNADIPHLTTWLALDDESDYAEMLRTVRPDVIHFHHYVHLGLELIRAAKRICPNARIVLTLHEYIAICMNSGQMVKTDGRLCHQASPRECAQCFPDRTPESFFLRERYIKSFFDVVDEFVSPSEFLRDRYIAWGIEAERITVIENGLPVAQKTPPRKIQPDGKRGRFAYFGQINPFKGVDVVLDAFARLDDEVKKDVTLDIFGSGLKNQSQEYQARFAKLLEENKDHIRYHGQYEPHEMGRIMADVDWVVMGSVWWENSPLVIQEAYKFGRPVICPDIGGMAEKVINGEGGLHYRVRDSISLASVVAGAYADCEQYDRLCAQLPQAMTIERCVSEHLALYTKNETSETDITEDRSNLVVV
ncbi:MAG: glycosyltransferase family 4 protein [Pseudomonadota bacterium]